MTTADAEGPGGAQPDDAPSGGANLDAPPDAALEAARRDVERLQAESEQHLAAWKRARADYENLKRRSASEVTERAAQATAGLLLSLLPVVDNFDRAFEIDREDDAAAWAEGIVLIRKDLVQVLERLGVQPIAAAGQPFDPQYHEAVGRAPGPDNEVLEQVRKGYLLGTRVLRPALVVVGHGDDAAPAPPADETEHPNSDGE
jgi:molecular chaperone GrpE